MPEFKSIYEKAPEKMTQAEFKIATVGLLNTVIKRLDAINDKVKHVETHKTYFKLIGIFTGAVILPILVWLIIRSF